MKEVRAKSQSGIIRISGFDFFYFFCASLVVGYGCGSAVTKIG